MEKETNGREVLLVLEKGGGELKAVTGLNKDGTPKAVKPEMKNEPDFIKLDRGADALENFFSNFNRQCKEPTHFYFFKVPLDKMESMVAGMQALLKDPDNPANAKMLEEHRVLPESYSAKKYQPIDESRIDWKQFETLGVSRSQIAKSGSLEKMLNWQKSPVLFHVKGEIGGLAVETDARLSLRETEDGKLNLRIHSVRKEPDLDNPIYGTLLTEEDKKNLRETGNAGRLVDFNFKDEAIKAYVSLDKLTNEVVILNAGKIRIPDELRGVRLSEEQKQGLREGKGVYVENMVSKDLKPYNAIVQVNADKRGLEMSFPKTPGQAETLGELIKRGEAPDTFRKVKLSEDQKNSLKEGYTVHISGMKDKAGKPYSGYLALNREKGEPVFMFPYYYKKALDAGLVKPDIRHKAQVAANNHGEKTEKIKKEEQKQEQQQRPEPKKSKGLKR